MSSKASTWSSSYVIAAGLSRATIRQNTHPSLTGSPRVVYNTARYRGPPDDPRKGDPDGHVPEVQASYPEERQPCETRLHVDPQGLPEPAGTRRQARLIRTRPRPGRRRPGLGSRFTLRPREGRRGRRFV